MSLTEYDKLQRFGCTAWKFYWIGLKGATVGAPNKQAAQYVYQEKAKLLWP